MRERPIMSAPSSIYVLVALMNNEYGSDSYKRSRLQEVVLYQCVPHIYFAITGPCNQASNASAQRSGCSKVSM